MGHRYELRSPGCDWEPWQYAHLSSNLRTLLDAGHEVTLDGHTKYRKTPAQPETPPTPALDVDTLAKAMCRAIFAPFNPDAAAHARAWAELIIKELNK